MSHNRTEITDAIGTVIIWAMLAVCVIGAVIGIAESTIRPL